MLSTNDRATSAHAEIRRLLLGGSLVVGDALKEIELSERIGVSRTPVREALHRLDGDGVVERRGRGYVVAGLDARAEAEVAQVRRALEPIGAANAAQAVADGLVAPASLAAIEQTIGDLEGAADRSDAAEAARANHAFHLMVACLGANREVTSIVERINDRLAVASLSRLRSAEWATEAAAQHADMLAAIADGNPEAASRATDLHLAAVESA